MSNSSPTKESLKTSSQQLEEIEGDFSKLTGLVNGKSSVLGLNDVTELLQELEGTDGMAQEVESKLDNVLSNLDDLLKILDCDSEGNTASDMAKASSISSEDKEPPTSGA